jgi:hypothetical protein
MKVDGIWKLEIRGPDGWERLATVFIEKGRYLSASADHYTVGRYIVNGKRFMAEASATQYGTVRTIFGSKQKQLNTTLKGKIKKDGSIVGTVGPTNGKAPKTDVRLNRLGDLAE